MPSLISSIANLITEDPDIFYNRIILETYEEGVHPSTKQFWSGIRKSKHPFAAHPLMAMYGGEAAQKSYEHTLERLQQAHPELQNAPPQQVKQRLMSLAMRSFRTIQQLEAPHRRQLEDLAEQLIHETWGVPLEMLDAKLGPPDEMSEELEMPEELEETPDMENVPIDREQVNKRITMNALTQGAAVHNMATIHHAAADELNEIDPKLLKAYQQFAAGSVHSYWIMDFANMTREMLSSSMVGSSRVSYDIESDTEFNTEGPEEYQTGNFDAPEEYAPEQSEPKVIARGINFPVLIQELVKGVMELLSHHGLEGIEEKKLKAIYSESDRLEDEPWLIQVGPQLWRAFLKIIPKGYNLAEIVAEVAAQKPKWIHDLLAKTVEAVHNAEDPAEARAILAQLMESIQEQGDEESEEDNWSSEWEPESEAEEDWR